MDVCHAGGILKSRFVHLLGEHLDFEQQSLMVGRSHFEKMLFGVVPLVDCFVVQLLPRVVFAPSFFVPPLPRLELINHAICLGCGVRFFIHCENPAERAATCERFNNDRLTRRSDIALAAPTTA
jgi:hypothetical protein